MSIRRTGNRVARLLLGPGVARPSAPAAPAPAAAPTCPDGWHVASPDFVGVGAQRSGTSWWYGLVGTHPKVASAPGSSKEVQYFAPLMDGLLPPGAASDYRQYFPRPPGSIAGEWTPRYMHDVWTPGLLHQVAPDARLLVLLRDPIERYRSGLVHEGSKARAAPAVFVAGDAFARGLYHEQLQRLLKHFRRDRVLVLQFEACLQRTSAELARTFGFLGLDTARPPRAVAEAKVNASAGTKPLLAEGLRACLVDAYRADTSRLVEAFPEIDLDLWPNMRGVMA